MKTRLLLFLCTTLSAGLPAGFGAAERAEPADFFEKKIRPVLVERCYKCHSAQAEKIRGGLTLDTREGIRRGGDDGPAVVPGDLESSLLIAAIRYQDEDTAMPPKTAGGKLPDAVIHDFEQWVKSGAPDPREGPAAAPAKKPGYDEARKWWAFQPPQISAPPTVKNEPWVKSDIDRFIIAALEGKRLEPVPDADKATLLRRITFDLTGLPPSSADVESFAKDCAAAAGTPSAISQLVDRLLASPQFGETWGRHWLDVSRFAESSGKDVNIAFPHAWRYRDYVIAAFNADKPWDEFVREQIAGDLLPAKDDRERAGHLVATGFLALGPKGLNEMNPRQFALDQADEQIDAMSQAFLGMTVSCARCHDHKFDPIPQHDYYALAGIFLSTDTHYGTALGIQNRHTTELIDLPPNGGAPTMAKTMPAEERERKEAQLAELKKEQQQLFAERAGNRRGIQPPGGAKPDANPPGKAGPRDNLRPLVVLTQIGFLEAELKSFDAETGKSKPLAMGATELPKTGGEALGGFVRRAFQGRFGGIRPPEFSVINDCALYARGDVDKPGEKVPRGFVSVLSPTTAPAIPKGESGRRQLADWIVARENPVTARVIVNRVWHWIFGRGLVGSVDNFGTTGSKPDNQALLDHLALHFQENGWSVKKLIREIMMSHCYQLGSKFDEKNFAADPDNALVWRMSPRRLDAECIRDAMLAISGQLELKPPVGSLIAYSGDGPIGGPRFRGVSEESITQAGGANRSVYLPIARDVVPDALAVFDFAEPSLVTGAREATNVPSQALYLLNSPFVAKAADKMAARILAAFPAGANGGSTANLPERLRHAYWLAFSRNPTEAETKAATDFFQKFPAAWKKGDASNGIIKNDSEVAAAWTSFCRALFASAEFRYLN